MAAIPENVCNNKQIWNGFTHITRNYKHYGNTPTYLENNLGHPPWWASKLSAPKNLIWIIWHHNFPEKLFQKLYFLMCNEKPFQAAWNHRKTDWKTCHAAFMPQKLIIELYQSSLSGLFDWCSCVLLVRHMNATDLPLEFLWCGSCFRCFPVRWYIWHSLCHKKISCGAGGAGSDALSFPCPIACCGHHLSNRNNFVARIRLEA